MPKLKPDIDWFDKDMEAFFEAHKAFHSSRDKFIQFEHWAASIITKHRESAIAELTAENKKLKQELYNVRKFWKGHRDDGC